MPYAVANGVRLYHEEHGMGEAIVCIHGTSSSAMVWRDVAVERLAGLGRVIIYDRRGCTRSERPEPYETSVSDHVEDAAALISALDAAPALVIGRSYGGGVAVGLARLTVPTLLVSGEDSLPAFRAINDRLAATIPGARTELVGGGHLIDPGEPGVLRFIGEVLGSVST